MNQKISAVIPNYNGLKLLQKNIGAVLHSLRNGDELIIVDDASTDASVEWLSEQFKAKNWNVKSSGQKLTLKIGRYETGRKRVRVVIVMNHRNLRFGRSCNRGVQIAQHPLIFLLNNDVSPHTNVLDYLVPYFQNPQVFAVAPLEMEKDGEKSGKNKLWFERGRFIHSRAPELTKGETAWVSGGSGLFDRQKWLQLNGFDADFAPAYWEDIDLSFRARQKKWLVLFEPAAIVDHNHESTNKEVFPSIELWTMSWRNGELFTRKHSNWWQKILFRVWQPYWWWQRRVHSSRYLV